MLPFLNKILNLMRTMKSFKINPINNSKSNFKNLLFLLIISSSIISIATINYLVDPYNLFKKDVNSVDFIFLPSKLIYPYFKLNQGQKCKHLVIGGSESLNILGPRVNSSTHYISRGAIEEIPDLLSAYLDLHKEIEHVIVCFSTVYPFRVSMIDSEKYTGKNLNIREIFNLLFSTDVIVETYNVLTHRTEKYVNAPTEKMTTRPNYLIKYYHSKETLDKKQKSVYSAIDKTIQILHDNHIKFTIVISPINSVYAAITNVNAEYRQKIEDFKRYLVNKVPEVYDFSLVTKYSSISLFDETNFYWQDYMHISYMFGIKYYKILFDNKNSDSSLYFKLTKDNIEEILKLEDNLLNSYINLNSSNINYYVNIAKGEKNPKNLKDLIFKSYEKMPDDLKNEILYFNNEVHDLSSTMYSNIL